MSARARTPAAPGPSLLRRLFAALRSKSAAAPDVTGSAFPAAPAPLQRLAGPGPILALALDASVKPAAPQPAVKPRQLSLMDPPAGPRPDRVFVIQDFIHRFRQVVAKQGITAKDPLAPMLEMLGEMLLHFTHLAEDQNTALSGQTRSTAAELRTAVEQVRGLHAEQIRAVDRSMTRSAERIEAAAADTQKQRAEILATFHKDTKDLLSRTVIHQTRVRTWTHYIVVAASIAVVAGGAYWLGSQAGFEQATASIKATETNGTALLLRYGPKAAQKWIALINWNDIRFADPTCAPQADGSTYRLACTYTFWSAPPVQTVPTAP